MSVLIERSGQSDKIPRDHPQSIQKEGNLSSMDAMYFVAIGSLAALVFAGVMFARVKRESPGTAEMERISGAVSKGATAYLKRQYKGVGIFFAAVFVIFSASHSFQIPPAFVLHFHRDLPEKFRNRKQSHSRPLQAPWAASRH